MVQFFETWKERCDIIFLFHPQTPFSANFFRCASFLILQIRPLELNWRFSVAEVSSVTLFMTMTQKRHRNELPLGDHNSAKLLVPSFF